MISRREFLHAGIAVPTAAYVASGQTPAPAVPSKTVIAQTDFTYIGKIRVPGAPANLTFSRATMTARVVGGVVHFFMTGNANDGDKVYEFAVTGEPDPVLTAAPVSRLVRDWSAKAPGGDLYGGRRITGGEAAWTWGLYFDPSINGLYWAYSTAYEGNTWNPSIGLTILNDDGSVTAHGPWRCSVHSGLANSSLFEAPEWFRPFVGGRKHLLNGSRHAQVSTAPAGAVLHSLTLPGVGVPADTGGSQAIPVQSLLLHDIDYPQPREGNYRFCGWETGNKAHHTVTTAFTPAGSTTLRVADTALFADPTGEHTYDGSGHYYGYLLADYTEPGHVRFDYVGKSTASGPGELTGVGIAQDIPAGAVVHLGNYGNGRGAWVAEPSPFFNGGQPALGVDFMDHSVWIEGPSKYGVVFFGQLVDTIPRYKYVGDVVTHACYGPGGGGPCIHGQPDSTKANVIWIYNPLHLVEVAQGSRSNVSVEPTSMFQAGVMGGLLNQRLVLRQGGQPWFHTATRRLYSPEILQDGTSPVIHVWQVDC